MKAVMVGQAARLGEIEAWRGSERSTARLCAWFRVAGARELHERFDCHNVGRCVGRFAKGDAFVLDEDLLALARDAARAADIAFLVGRAAQRALAPWVRTRRPLWRQYSPTLKLVGLPHPSGINIQLNSLPDEAVADFVASCLAVALEEAG